MYSSLTWTTGTGASSASPPTTARDWRRIPVNGSLQVARAVRSDAGGRGAESYEARCRAYQEVPARDRGQTEIPMTE